MSTINLAKLPDRAPIRISITVMPDLHDDLQAYSRAYEAAYGSAVAVQGLIPAIPTNFIAADQGFRRRKRGL